LPLTCNGVRSFDTFDGRLWPSRPSSTSAFDQLEKKTLAAEKRDAPLALAQYAFEEICAKTLYNMTGEPAPFDPDSPFWGLPLALELGQMLGTTDAGEISPLLAAK
jgi:hypothetical protein